MSEYDSFPPYPTLKKILTSYPQAALFYLMLWKVKKPTGQVIIQKEESKEKFIVSKTLIRNYLMHLRRLELLTYEESMDIFLIVLVL